MSGLRVAVVPGDGIGVEVIAEAVKVLTWSPTPPARRSR